MVESLKNKVISCARSKLKKNRYEEKKIRKPIEVWTRLASALAGTHEESISSAFSQVLIQHKEVTSIVNHYFMYEHVLIFVLRYESGVMKWLCLCCVSSPLLVVLLSLFPRC